MQVERPPTPETPTTTAAEVVVTLPGEDGVPGPTPVQHPSDLWLDDEHVRLGIGMHIYVEPEPRYYLQASILQEMIARPSDRQLVAISPRVALIFSSWLVEWRCDRVRWGDGLAIESEELFGPEVHMAQAIIDGAPGSEQARWASLTLIQAAVAAAPEDQREQLLWDAMVSYLDVEQFEEPYQEPGLLLFGLRSIRSPEIRPQDHATFARYFEQTWGRAPGFHGQQRLHDILIRDALEKGDVGWARYWWAWVEQGRKWRYGEENGAQLAGAVLALGDEAHTWEDGLRRAAVLCHKERRGVALEADISVVDGAWQVEAADRPGAFLDCTLDAASPMAPEGQRARLVVVQTPAG